MMPVVRIILLMLFLLIGAYATHVADKQVKDISISKKRMNQLKSSLDENDYAFMQMSLNPGNYESAHEHGSTSGSLIVNGGRIIGAGWDGLNSSSVPTDHAALKAVKEASIHLGTPSLKGSVFYSGTQPCPMCLSLLYLTEIDKIIYFSDSDTTNLTPVELMNQRVYGSLIKTPSERTIPEIVLRHGDL
jgi:guanine deaminase